MQDFMELLQQAQSVSPVQKAVTAPPLNKRANQTCDFEGFIEMLRRVIVNVMPNCLFIPQDDVQDYVYPDVSIDNTPIISYEVIERAPLKEQKPMLRHEVIEKAYETSEERIGNLYAWQMVYQLQFNIYASGYEKSQRVMNTFEEAILEYLGYFKKNGIIECLFKKQLKDDSLSSFREHASIKSLRYQVTLEKYWIDFDSVLESVYIQNQEKKDERTERGKIT